MKRAASVLMCLVPTIAGSSISCSLQRTPSEEICTPGLCSPDAGVGPTKPKTFVRETQRRCGDGRSSADEACDDGNNQDGDGCDASCEVERGFGCAGEPSACDAICGDALILGDETCDDGNLRDDDGCSSNCVLRLQWRPVPGDTALTPRYAAARVLANEEIFVFGGELLRYTDQPFGVATGDGAIYNPETRAWRAVNPSGAPSPRARASAVWTGSEIIVWGGAIDRTYNDGALYDPVRNTWRPMAPNPFVLGRSEHSAVWTGREMIVFGGWGPESEYGAWGALRGGEAYSPDTDTWRPLATEGAPIGRWGHTAIWTDTDMIIFGGRPLDWNPELGDGAAYDPELDGWRPIRAGTPRISHAAIWTGTKMIVLGGADGPGAAYDPRLDTWDAIAEHTDDSFPYTQAFWTGSEILWIGGHGGRYIPAVDAWFDLPPDLMPHDVFDMAAAATRRWLVWFSGEAEVIDGRENSSPNGAQLDLQAQTWTPIHAGVYVEPRSQHAAAAFGNDMIIWGGVLDEYHILPDGFRIDVVTGARRTLPSADAPTPRIFASMTASDHAMVIFGGRDIVHTFSSRALGDGAIFDAIEDRWSPLPADGAPSPRSEHAAVIADSDVILFGGFDGTSLLDDGGLFNLTTRTWRPLARNAFTPSPRSGPTMVWTGDEVLVWGGLGDAVPLGDGAAYDPARDQWRPISMDGAPSPRVGHTATWTGREMIIFGGKDVEDDDPGARYDPIEDRWTPLPRLDAPSARHGHTATWSGAQLVVFGGLRADESFLEEGARYDPELDAWLPLPTAYAPGARFGHTALWMNSALVIFGGSHARALNDGAILDL